MGVVVVVGKVETELFNVYLIFMKWLFFYLINIKVNDTSASGF